MLASLSKSFFKGHYLDTQATAALDPRVLDAMMPYEIYKHGNAHSKQHQFGAEAKAAVEKARKSVADLINAKPNDIIFTSGATECNNISIKGSMHYLKNTKGKDCHSIQFLRTKFFLILYHIGLICFNDHHYFEK